MAIENFSPVEQPAAANTSAAYLEAHNYLTSTQQSWNTAPAEVPSSLAVSSQFAPTETAASVISGSSCPTSDLSNTSDKVPSQAMQLINQTRDAYITVGPDGQTEVTSQNPNGGQPNFILHPNGEIERTNAPMTGNPVIEMEPCPEHENDRLPIIYSKLMSQLKSGHTPAPGSIQPWSENDKSAGSRCSETTPSGTESTSSNCNSTTGESQGESTNPSVNQSQLTAFENMFTEFLQFMETNDPQLLQSLIQQQNSQAA